ncbi:hypothetical protein [Chryseobacterium sp. JAH]|uniref:hypothetical protein n=1 Tax=Chryseobacterium sp. JAH TaxID=1742858 RepID=UPI000740CEFF|nr:hypothetical protein [Chryseobacterium sp. JAH]KUJ49931.1 hypothetical protein AR685_17060 [Chryseobacterium sp. JAH]
MFAQHVIFDLAKKTMKQIALILAIFYSAINLNAQNIKFRENIDKDSLFNVAVQKLPIEMRGDFTKTYKSGNEQEKEFLLFMTLMPESNKQELIANFENKKTEIQRLKTEFQKLVPKNYVVDIEFKPESKILTVSEEITIKIYKVKKKEEKEYADEIERSDDLKVISQNWNLKPNSNELGKIIKSIGWTNQTLDKIKKLLNDANCISIENGKITTIGFARSGMGKYYYKIFEKPLSEKSKTEYNNNCQYIFYKDNIVLEYGGGAIGSQCFEKH